MKTKRPFAPAMLTIAAPSAAFLFAQQSILPPVAPRIEHREVRHGENVDDPYFWLREKSNPAVIKYLEGENACTTAMTGDLKPIREVLYAEMLKRIKQTDLSVPVRK